MILKAFEVATCLGVFISACRAGMTAQVGISSGTAVVGTEKVDMAPDT